MFSYSGNGFEYSNYYNDKDLFRVSDYNFENVRKRKFKHSRRMAFLVRSYNIKRVSMLTLTVKFDGLYKSAKEYDNALNRVRRFFNYYKINRITGSEFTQKGVKHYHIVFNSEDIKRICALPSFKRFVKKYKFNENDIKAIRSGKRSYLEVYIARYFFQKWRLGWCDFEKEAKPLYIVKYVNESYNDEVSLHGRISYSREFSRWFSKLTSISFLLYDNVIKRFVPNFQVPIFFIPAVQKQMKHLFYERMRSEFGRLPYKYKYEKYRYFKDCEKFPEFYQASERLGLMNGY